MIRIIVASLISVFAFASISFAQSVPDLSSKNWEFLSEINVILSVDLGNGQEGGLPTTAKFYKNEADKISASVLMWKGDEVAMTFGTQDDHVFAIKVKGGWYVAKDRNETTRAVAVYESDGKPSGVKMTLETTDGLKEVMLNFEQNKAALLSRFSF